MACYLITRTDSEDLETIVFAIGEEQQQESIAAFMSPEKASDYIAAAGWEDEYCVAELEPIDTLRWLLQAYDEGITSLVINPEFDSQADGDMVDSMNIAEQLTKAGRELIELAAPDF